MKYKEKHLAALVLAANLFMGCSENKNTANQEQEYAKVGLLDEHSLQRCDKYDTKVMLYQVNVPVYQSNGKRIKDQFVLTRGLKKTTYVSRQSLKEMSVKAVYINNNPEKCYVKADKNNAIYTERGFSGLFIDENDKAVVVADENVTDFIATLNSLRSARHNNVRQYQNVRNIQKEEPEDMSEPLFEDSLKTDFLKEDSINRDTVFADTLSMKKYAEKQLADTLRILRQKEI